MYKSKYSPSERISDEDYLNFSLSEVRVQRFDYIMKKRGH